MTPASPRLFLISGSGGVGKTTVCAALLKRFPLGIHIPVDNVRNWVVAGKVEPMSTNIEGAKRQFMLARSAAREVARRYHAAGYAVAIDDVYTLRLNIGAGFDAGFPDLKKRRVLLLPRLDVVLSRNRARTNKRYNPKILERPIVETTKYLQATPSARAGWRVIDNSDMTVEETADAILRD